MKMIKTSGILLTTVLASVMFMQCSKDDSNAVFNTRFYTDKPNAKLSLYIDDVYQGKLPYFSTKPECGQEYGDGLKPLLATLPSGEYRITGKNEHDSVVSFGVMRLSRNKMSVSGNRGGLSVQNNGDCVIVGVSE